MVDLTHRCNMNCANCYIPNREIADIDADRLIECLSKFPKRTNIRLAGAEPTLRSDLLDIISRIRKLGHRVVLLTNGLRLSRKSYVSELYDAGLRHIYISLNGADNDDWYERIDNLRCARKKIQALENIVDKNMILNTGTILMRGVNEQAIQRVVDLVTDLNPRHALLRFKNVGALGRYDQDAEKCNLSMFELERLTADAIDCRTETLSRFNKIKGNVEPNTRLFPVNLSAKTGTSVWIKLSDWQADNNGLVDLGSTRRGRITPNFMVAPFFEHVKEFEGSY